MLSNEDKKERPTDVPHYLTVSSTSQSLVRPNAIFCLQLRLASDEMIHMSFVSLRLMASSSFQIQQLTDSTSTDKEQYTSYDTRL